VAEEVAEVRQEAGVVSPLAAEVVVASRGVGASVPAGVRPEAEVDSVAEVVVKHIKRMVDFLALGLWRFGLLYKFQRILSRAS